MTDRPGKTQTPPDKTGDPAGSSAETPQPDLTERTLGDFRLLRRLGKGGMAEVYLAEQVSLKRQVAVKVLRTDQLDEREQVLVKRFEQEALAAGGLSHPNIVQVYMVGREGTLHYIAQEYVQGPNLKDFLKRKGPPELTLALHFMRQTASALQTAAEAGIVHRDIKPENIMLTRKGEVKVADFGLAQLARNTEGSLTQVGMTMGTPLYMSPEQINGKKVDHRSDIYSFGVTCYHLLAGRPPFQGETPLSIAVKHLNEQAPSLSTIRTDLPQPVIEMVEKMMAKDPAERYATAGEVVAEIKRILKLLREDPDSPELSLADLSISTSQPTRSVALLPAHFGRHVAVFLGCSLFVLAATAGIGWALRTEDPLALPVQPDAISVDNQGSADKQYEYADSTGTIAAWKAVLEFYGEDPLVAPKAKVRLALAYIRDDRFEEARGIFNEFDRRATMDDNAQAIATAGFAMLAYVEERDYDKAQVLLDKVDVSKLTNTANFLIEDLDNMRADLKGIRERKNKRPFENADVET